MVRRFGNTEWEIESDVPNVKNTFCVIEHYKKHLVIYPRTFIQRLCAGYTTKELEQMIKAIKFVEKEYKELNSSANKKR